MRSRRRYKRMIAYNVPEHIHTLNDLSTACHGTLLHTTLSFTAMCEERNTARLQAASSSHQPRVPSHEPQIEKPGSHNSNFESFAAVSHG